MACNSDGCDVNPLLSSPSAATTAAINIETLEHVGGRGSDTVAEMTFSANGKIVGAFNIKLRVRKNIIEENWHGTEGERQDKVERIRKQGEASTAAPGEVTVMITSLTMEALQQNVNRQNKRPKQLSHQKSRFSNESVPALQKGGEHAEHRGVARNLLFDNQCSSTQYITASAKTWASRAAALTAASRTRKLMSLVELLL
jgi:hypothetical protein